MVPVCYFRDDLLYDLLGELCDDVRGIIRIQFLQFPGDFLGGQVAQDRFPDILIQFGEDIRGFFAVQEFDQVGAWASSSSSITSAISA